MTTVPHSSFVACDERTAIGRFQFGAMCGGRCRGELTAVVAPTCATFLHIFCALRWIGSFWPDHVLLFPSDEMRVNHLFAATSCFPSDDLKREPHPLTASLHKKRQVPLVIIPRCGRRKTTTSIQQCNLITTFLVNNTTMKYTSGFAFAASNRPYERSFVRLCSRNGGTRLVLFETAIGR